MKKIFLRFPIFLGLISASRENTDLSQQQNTNDGNALLQRQSSIFNY